MKTTLSKAISLADKWFSLYVRLYGADYRGMVACVTCPTKKHFRDIDNGHYQGRNHKATRWHEQNGNPQCSQCNKWGQGEQVKHARYIDNRYGKGTAEKLEVLAHTTVKLNVWDVLAIAKKYRELALIEAEKRGIDLGEPKTNRILDGL